MDDHRLSVRSIDDSASTSSGLTRVMMKSNTADNSSVTDLILCNLHYPSCLQQPLDLEFYDGQTLTFTAKGPCRYARVEGLTCSTRSVAS